MKTRPFGEKELLDAYPPDKIKRYEMGETSNWDDLPFRERYSKAFRPWRRPNSKNSQNAEAT